TRPAADRTHRTEPLPPAPVVRGGASAGRGGRPFPGGSDGPGGGLRLLSAGKRGACAHLRRRRKGATPQRVGCPPERDPGRKRKRAPLPCDRAGSGGSGDGGADSRGGGGFG